MKRKLMTFTAGFACFLLAFPVCVPASDPTHIAFASQRDGNHEIYIMDINGENLQNLTNHPSDDFAPALSSNERWMAYVSKRDGNREIYVMNLKTKVSHRLTNHPQSDDEPTWAPDSQSIIFVSR